MHQDTLPISTRDLGCEANYAGTWTLQLSAHKYRWVIHYPGMDVSSILGISTNAPTYLQGPSRSNESLTQTGITLIIDSSWVRFSDPPPK
jgi:hypothetical protein